MRPLELDFQAKYWLSYRAGTAVLFSAVVACILEFGIHVLTGTEIKSQESEWLVSQSMAKNNGSAIFRNGSEKTERLKPELKRANEIVQQLTLPWEQLFEAIEVFDPNQVALLRIETDMSRHSFTLTAEAKSFNGMLGYVKNLGNQAALTDVYLVNHQILEEDELKPVRFSVSGKIISR